MNKSQESMIANLEYDFKVASALQKELPDSIEWTKISDELHTQANSNIKVS